jgi:hypothetical protein
MSRAAGQDLGYPDDNPECAEVIVAPQGPKPPRFAEKFAAPRQIAFTEEEASARSGGQRNDLPNTAPLGLPARLPIPLPP